MIELVREIEKLKKRVNELAAREFAGIVSALTVTNDTRIGGGLHVGATDVDPTAGTITADQGAGDGEILSVQSYNDVAHGMTDVTATYTYGFLKKVQATSGGLQVEGLKDADGVAGYALYLVGALGEAADTTKTAAGIGVITLDAYVKSGTNIAAAGADANLVTIANGSTTRFIFDAEGSAHADVEWVAFETHDDFALIEALEEYAADPKSTKALKYDKNYLEAQKLVKFSTDAGGKDHVMVNTTKVMMLYAGALRKTQERLLSLEAKAVK